MEALLESLPFHILHRVKTPRTGKAEMVDRCDVLMPEGRRCARFSDKPLSNPFVPNVPRRNHLQSSKATQISIYRLIGHAHGSPAQLHRFAVFAFDQLVILKPARRADRLVPRRTGLPF